MTHATPTAGGSAFPELRRLRYFNGQMLTAGDFQREQGYFIEKLRLRNRCLHGYGIACGLAVRPVPPDDPCFRTGRPLVRIEPGVAVDCLGNEIVVTYPCVVDLWHELSAADQAEIRAAAGSGESGPTGNQAAGEHEEKEDREHHEDREEHEAREEEQHEEEHEEDEEEAEEEHGPREAGRRPRVYLSVAYCERPVGPTRGVFLDDCGNGTDCEYGWCRDAWHPVVSLEAPRNDGCADPCCECCPDARVLLARIDDVRPDEAVDRDDIRLDERRPLARYHYTTITGINWTHGGTYTREQVSHLLAARDGHHHGPGGGLRVEFSAPVRAASLRPGVVEIRVIEGGRGRNAESWYVAGRFTGKPDEGLVTGFRYEQTTDETVQHGDQINITIRTPFILDRCCRPVDGTHVGGRVPLLHGYEPGRHHPPGNFCPRPPDGVGRWTTGTGTGAGVFESWIYVDR